MACPGRTWPLTLGGGPPAAGRGLARDPLPQPWPRFRPPERRVPKPWPEQTEAEVKSRMLQISPRALRPPLSRSAHPALNRRAPQSGPLTCLTQKPQETVTGGGAAGAPHGRPWIVGPPGSRDPPVPAGRVPWSSRQGGRGPSWASVPPTSAFLMGGGRLSPPAAGTGFP